MKNSLTTENGFLKTKEYLNYSNYGKINKYRYTFKYHSRHLYRAILTQEKYQLSLSKIIGMGLNYLRTIDSNIMMKMLKEEQKLIENELNIDKKNKRTTIALTRANYEFLKKIPKELVYTVLIKAVYIGAKIYNPKKDQYK